MNTKESNIYVVVIFLGITLFSCIALVSASTILWGFLRLLNLQVDLMATIEAISTAVAAGAVFGAGFIAYRELSEVANTRYKDIADRLFADLNSPENIDARRWIFQNLVDDPEEGTKGLTKEGQDAIKKVLNSLDHVAFLTRPGWIPDKLVMPWMHPMIAKSWEKLEPYVMHERKVRGESYYYKYAEELAQRCIKWREANLSEEEQQTNWINNAI